MKFHQTFTDLRRFFSGYLSEQQQYIDAFSLHPDHVLMSGSIQEVEHQLEVFHPKGKKRENYLFTGA